MDLGNYTEVAVTSTDQKVLEKTGSGGILSNGYLFETPFAEYLESDERLRAVLCSAKKAPESEGLLESQVQLNGFRSITGISDDRVLSVAGTPEGNQVIEVPLHRIERFETDSSGIIRTKQWLRLITPSGSLTVYDHSGVEFEAVENCLIDSVSRVRRTRVNELVEDIDRFATEEAGYRSRALLREAESEAELLFEWEEAHESGLPPLEDTVEQDLSLAREQVKKPLRDELRRIHDSVEGPLRETHVANESDSPLTVYEDTFGSWSDALASIGVDYRASLRRELRRLWKERGEEPGKAAMAVDGAYGLREYKETFGSWDAAIEAVDYRDADDEQATLLQALERLWGDRGCKPTKAAILVETRYRLQDYRDAFGSWNAAIEAADPSTKTEDSNGTSKAAKEPTVPSASGKRSEGPDRGELVDELKRVNEETPGLTKAGDVRSRGQFTIKRYSDEFGSWEDALEAAEINRENQLVAEIRRVWRELDDRPLRTQMDKHGRVSSTTCANYFGGWTVACEDWTEPITDRRKRQSESEPSDVSRDASDTYLSEIDSLIVWEEIPGNTRLPGAYLGRVSQQAADPGSRKDAEVQVADIYGEESWLDIWEKHDVTARFEKHHWYLFTELRGKVWDTDGTTTKRLSSTKDLSVTDLGPTPDVETLRNEAEDRGVLGVSAMSNSDVPSGDTIREHAGGGTIQRSSTKDPDDEADRSPVDEVQAESEDAGSDDILDQILDDVELE
jgi:hypothetical protein